MTTDKQATLIEVADLSLSTIKAYAYRLPSGFYYVTASPPSVMAHPLAFVAVKGRVETQHRGVQPSQPEAVA